MYDPDSRLIKTGPIAMLLFVMVSSLFGPANFSGFWWLYGCLMALVFLYVVYMIFWCESFTVFTLSLLSSFVFSFGFSAAGLAHVVLLSDLGFSGFEAGLVNAVLLSAVFAIYAIIYFSSSKLSPFRVSDDNRVSRVSISSGGVSPLMISGIGTLASAAFISSVSSLTSGVVAALGLFFSCVGLIIYERHAISGLRTLRAQEKAMSTTYTFVQIEAIREARSRWLLGRLFKWAFASRKSPDS